MKNITSVSSNAKLRPLKLPQVTQSMTSQGLPVYVAPRGSLPLVAVRLVVHAGSCDEPADKEGLADFTMQLLRRGTASFSAQAMNEAVEFVGGSLGTSASEDYLAIGMTVPSAHLKDMLNLLGQLVTEPTFPKHELEMARRRVLAEMANDFDDPAYLVERALLKAIWGTHPYGHDPVGSRRSIESMTREDVVQFHKSFFTARNAALFIVGDVNPEAAMDAAESALAGFRGEKAARKTVDSLTSLKMSKSVLVVDKPDATQTQVRMAGMGAPKGHPDYFDYAVMNAVLGGGFTSRLVGEIRVKRGLSYGAVSYFHSLKHAGTFGFSSFTKTESTRELIDVALETMEAMREKGPKPSEVASAQKYLNGIYPSRIETNEAVSGALADLLIYGLPENWVEQYRHRIAAVTKAGAWAAARKYLPRDERVIVLVGNADKIVPKLKGLGQIEVLRAAQLE